MVYTVTLNPALDYVLKVDNLSFEEINRAKSSRLYFGGKGINVSCVLSRLKVKTTALGFIGGFTGEKLEELLKDEGIICDFVKLEKGETRINVKIRAEKELDINANGDDINEENINSLLKKLDEIKDGDYLVLAGSVPKNTPSDIYERMMQRLENKNINFVVDAEGKLLLNALKYKPFLIKPNHIELSELFGVSIKTKADAVIYAEKLRNMGAKNVLVSMAENGAVLLDENGGVHSSENAKGKLINSTGCGDSMIAGFICEYLNSKDYSKALKLATACGNATAFSDFLAQVEEIYNIYNNPAE